MSKLVYELVKYKSLLTIFNSLKSSTSSRLEYTSKEVTKVLGKAILDLKTGIVSKV